MQVITPCLWFDTQAEQAAAFYTSLFKDGRVISVSHHGEGTGMPAGTVLTIVFEINGQRFSALNGGPHFTFSEAISFAINCDTQQEIDEWWDKLLADGGQPQACGWLKDKFGLSWQIVPADYESWIVAGDAAAQRVMDATMQMVKLDMAALRAAHAG